MLKRLLLVLLVVIPFQHSTRRVSQSQQRIERRTEPASQHLRDPRRHGVPHLAILARLGALERVAVGEVLKGGLFEHREPSPTLSWGIQNHASASRDRE